MLVHRWKCWEFDLGRVAAEREVAGIVVRVECWTGGGFTHGHAITRVAGRLFSIAVAGQA